MLPSPSLALSMLMCAYCLQIMVIDSYLCMNQSVVEQDEPVNREPPGVLEGQALVATLIHQPALGITEDILGAEQSTTVFRE